MKYYLEPARKIPIVENMDVLVAGAGPAGVAAAIAAARQGAHTTIVEECASVGGVATSGMMSHWAGSAKSGILNEIIELSAKRNEGKFENLLTKTIDTEKLKTLLLDMLDAAGVKIRLYTHVSDVILADGRVNGVVIESKSGRQAIGAKITVDATGDGDVAEKSGAEFACGREQDGGMQPVTIMFKVGGVDYERAVFLESFESTFQTPHGELQELAREKLTPPAGHVLLYKSTLPGVVTCNMTNCTGINGTNAEDLTHGMMVCRRQIDEIVAFLRRFAPGYENCYAISSAERLGVRETRRFKGIYTLTEHDILSAADFDDWVVRDARFNFDVHNITGAGLDKTGAQAKFAQKSGYSIPFGCLIPEKINGLLLSGRNISGTHIAHSNYRVMPICAATGEAAGIAAAIAARTGAEPRDIDVREIQKIMG